MASVVAPEESDSEATKTEKSTGTVKKANKVERVTVRVTGELGNSIRELQDVTTSTSPSEVVRRAVLVYHTLVKQKLEGNEPLIAVRNEDEERTIPIFL